MAKSSAQDAGKSKWLVAGLVGFAGGMFGVCLLLAAATLIIRPAFLRPQPATPTAGEVPTPVVENTPPPQPIPGLWADIPLPENNGDMNISNKAQCALSSCTDFGFSTRLPMKEVLEFYRSGMTSNGWEIGQDSQFVDGSTATLMYSRPMLENDGRSVNLTIHRYGFDAEKQTVILFTQSD